MSWSGLFREVLLFEAPQSKEGLRQEMAARRASLAPGFLASAGIAATERLLARQEIVESSEVGLYWSFGGELPTQECFHRLRERGHRVYLPRLRTETRTLEFVAVDEARQLKPGAYGILEPEPGLVAMDISRLRSIVVPGLVFDLRGARIGRGQGYYDRTLSGYRGSRLALAYDFQVLAQIPAEAHDERVNVIVTESRAIEVGREK